MPKARTEAFSDAVIAVAITLLALDLPIPHPSATAGLGHRLLVQWPNFVAFFVSFLTIGVIWINHHAMLRRLARLDHAMLVLNLLLLLSICVLPFTTALMADYLKTSNGERLAAAIYAGSLLVMSLFFFAMQARAMRGHTELLHEGVTPETRTFVVRRNAAGLIPYLVATAAAVISPYVTLAITALVAVFYAIPTTTRDVAG
jgi:TMEM175 potassium channel family protein